MTLIGHLESLRKVLIKSFIAILACSFIFYKYSNLLLVELIKPVGKVVFLSPAEAFVTNVKVALSFGLIFSSPFVIFQIWQFVSSGLTPIEKKYIRIFGPASFLFFIIGIFFGYFVIVPIGLKFLLSFASESLLPMIAISKYISYLLSLTFSSGLVFETPIVILFLTKVGIISPGVLTKRRREAIVFIFILAAFLTPPDVISQLLMALPLLVLYELSIFFSKIVYKEKQLQG